MGDDSITYEFLSTDIFKHYDTHLVFTGVTRNSKKILKDITENLDKIKPLLKTADTAYDVLQSNDYEKFLYLIGKSWHQKKETSSTIMESDIIIEMDYILEINETVCAHILCGAGNGGFFLIFSEKDTLNIPLHCVKIDIETSGVYGKSI